MTVQPAGEGRYPAGDAGVLVELGAAAAVKRAARRWLADITAEHGLRATELAVPREAHRAATNRWVELLRQAYAAGHPVADIARSAGVTGPSVYYRLRTGSAGAPGS